MDGWTGRWIYEWMSRWTDVWTGLKDKKLNGWMLDMSMYERVGVHVESL